MIGTHCARHGGEDAMGSTARGATKYRPLVAYLAAQRAPAVACTFAHIEGIVGFPLPRTARTMTGF